MASKIQKEVDMSTKAYIVLQQEGQKLSLHALDDNKNLLNGIHLSAICYLTHTSGDGLVKQLSHGIDSGSTCLINKLSADEFCFVLTEGTPHLNGYASDIPADFVGSLEEMQAYLREIEISEEQTRLTMELPF
jgi:hypothetical protein